MKIYKNIFEKMISVESLLEAWDGFKKGKRKKRDVQEFELRLEDNLF
ncbi:MAG: RNA-dependent DNA polymerase, partial [Candidatus Colwellbacteria bacterium]|nr:RNA-dependent DNA polymerase [Candidatus Colwellbacteria bacterium]